MSNEIKEPDYRELTKDGMQEIITKPESSPLYMPIKALCWKQPFASLMLEPHCKVETRPRRIAYRGLVLIVATASPYKDHELVQLCGGEQALMNELRVAGHDGYVNGAAIGIGLLWKCCKIQDDDQTYIDPAHHVGRFAWHFKDVFAIEPIPLKGFQGWRNVHQELRNQIVLL